MYNELNTASFNLVKSYGQRISKVFVKTLSFTLLENSQKSVYNMVKITDLIIYHPVLKTESTLLCL